MNVRMPRWWIERRIARLEEERSMLEGMKLESRQAMHFNRLIETRVRIRQIDFQLEALRKGLA